MNRLAIYLLISHLPLYSCKSINCGPGTIERDGQCIADIKSQVEDAIEKSEEKKQEKQEIDKADEEKKTKLEIQKIVDNEIKSWQESWTRANGAFGVSKAKGTVVSFEETENQSITALVDVEFQFTYGKRILIRNCISTDFCSGTFREGKNEASVVMRFDRVGFEMIYSSHFVKNK